MDDFSKQKIVWSGVSSNFNFVRVEENIFINAPANFLTSGFNDYLLFFLNSDLIEWYYRTYSTLLGNNGIRFYVHDFLKIPIPIPQTNKVPECVYDEYGLSLEEKEYIKNFFK